VRRAPGSSASAGFSLAGFLVGLLAIVVIGGTAVGYARWQSDIAAATDTAIDPAGSDNADAADERDDDLPAAPDSPDEVVEEPEEPAYEDPTFQVLEPTENRPQPVVLLVGDGYAYGRGASNAGTAYSSLLARDLGWDVRLATATGAGYVSAPPTLLDLLVQSPPDLAPDLVIVQGGYGADASSDAAKSAVEELRTTIERRHGDVPVVAVTAFAPDGITEQLETRERTIARAWREDPDVLVLRPQIDSWSDPSADDPGHELIAGELVSAFRKAGLAP
jgi:plasmid stabilization system protein ParE